MIDINNGGELDDDSTDALLQATARKVHPLAGMGTSPWKSTHLAECLGLLANSVIVRTSAE
jgi:hypothetical protein